MARSFGLARILVITAVTLAVAGLLYIMALRATAEPMALLYGELSLAEAADVAARLESEGTKFETREVNGGVSILAPESERARLKLALAADGFIATSGMVGYEIFDKEDALGVTSFQQNINKLRALEGEIARTIATLSGVRSARVHLVLPERELFSRDKERASASIVVDAPGGLDKRSVRAIVNLTASAVPGLTPQRVTVLDQAGGLLASGQEGDDPLASAGGVDERISATEARIRRTVEDIVGRIVGPDNLRVQVAADLDFSRITETANIIDPDSQTVLSSTTVEDQSNDRDPSALRGVTIANQLPEAAIVDPANSGEASTSTARRIEETTNFEMTRTVRNEVREAGGLKRLSVAVALNAGPAPRPEAELRRIQSLVQAAVGYNPARGDQINVVETAFQPVQASTIANPGTTASATASPLLSRDLLRLGELAAVGAIIIALVVFVLRPLLAAPNRAPAPSAVLSTQATRSTDLPAAAGVNVTTDLAVTSLRRVAEVMKSNSAESAGIIKDWIRKAS
ncbi:MAG: flagellar basal-body MS-ring/collar protein FliF [Parvularculaceae bacterium]|nr:flagellar basal-body MS-ring/collar protein FliF [Parvularculaceae bacterium]